MAKWKLFLAIVCSFVAGALILLAVLVYVPRTTELDYDMRGFLISADGQIMEEFTMTATGKEYDFIIDRPNGDVTFSGNTATRVEKDTFYLDIDWGSSMISKNASDGLFMKDFCVPHTQFILGYIYSSTSGRMEREYGIFDPAGGVLYLYADDLAENAFIVGITDPDADPLEILKLYQSVEGLLHRPELLPPTESQSPDENDGTAINWSMNGTFALSDGTTNAVNFTVNGHIHDSQDGTDVLDITIAFPDNFRYSVNTSNLSYVSVNQKYNDLPHLMICPTYVYDRQTNSSVWTYFAFDLEKKYVAVMFESLPDCYLVASEDSSADYSQLLDHFADFMESYAFKD